MEFVSDCSVEERQEMHRRAYEEAVERYFALLRTQYVGRSFMVQGRYGPYTVQVERIDDGGNVLLICASPRGYNLSHMVLLSWREFVSALAAHRLVAS